MVSACVPAWQTDRQEDRMRRGRVKNSFSFLCLCPGIWAFENPDHPASPHRLSIPLPGQQQWPPCWGVFPVPCRAGMAVRLQPFPIRKQASDSCVRAGERSGSATSRLTGGGFIVGGTYQLSIQTQGGIHEKELWIHIEYQFLPSADTPPLSALLLHPLSLPLSLLPSLHPSISDGPPPPPSLSPTHFLPFLSIYASFLPSLSPPSLSSMQL